MHKRINHGEDISIESDENSDADDESYEDTADESDDDFDFSEKDVVHVNGNDSKVKQREITEADRKVYN